MTQDELKPCLIWNRVEDTLPPVEKTVLVASPDALGWRVRSACLFIRHEGVHPSPLAIGSTDFWFDAPRGQNDMRLVREGIRKPPTQWSTPRAGRKAVVKGRIGPPVYVYRA